MASSSGPFCCNPYGRHKQAIDKGVRNISQNDVKKNPLLTFGLSWCDNCRKMEPPKIIEECCNPFGLHKKNDPIVKSLRAILETDKVRQPTVTVGLIWCDRCRKAPFVPPQEPSQETDPDSAPNSQQGGSQSSDNLSPAIKTERAGEVLQSLGLSPLVTGNARTQGSKVTVAKRKMEEVQAKVSKKIFSALGVSAEEAKSDIAVKARDHDLLMDAVKEKLKTTSSKVVKYQLLSLIPSSMSAREAAQFFGVSRTVVDRAQKLKEEQGIIPAATFSRVSSVTEPTKQLVRIFFCSDENSRIMPGSRDCVSVKKGVYEQKRLLLSNLPELYESFKECHPDAKIGLTMFCALKPKWCISAGQAGTHEQCVCQIHQNMKLSLFALKINVHYREIIATCVCDINNRSCMLRVCEKCPTLDEVKNVLKLNITLPDIYRGEELSPEEEFDFYEETVKFRQWRSTDRTEMIVEICSRGDLIERVARQISDLIPHDFIACSQRDYVKKMKEELQQDKVVIAMDFSMNYNCLVQGAVQSYHWSPKQATVHPTVIYHKDENNLLQHHSIVFISDDLDHDVPLVQAFQEEAICYVKNNMPGITKIEFLTDGCACQYKSKGYFQCLCKLEKKHEMEFSHSYFATSHGKSQCDADGGSVKRKARRASLQRPLDNQIISAMDLYNFCQEEMNDKFIFKFVAKSEVQNLRIQYQEQMPSLVAVPGTRTFHFIRPIDDNVVACWRVSNDQAEPASLVHSLVKITRPRESVNYYTGMYVIVRLSKNRYVGIITDSYPEEGEVDVSLLMPKLPTKEMHWPNEVKSATIPLPHIVCAVQLQEADEKFHFTPEQLETLYALRIMKRPA